MFCAKDHTFVICAYQESQYLDACIQSLLSQTVKSHIILATSTPNEFIRRISGVYGLKMFENHGESGIAGDWNFALSCAETELVTLAHQDDFYEPLYTERMLECINKSKNPILFSSAYSEMRNGKKVFRNRLLNVKKLLIIPIRILPGSIGARRLSLAFGNAICCPSVTYKKEIIMKYPFQQGLRASLDWQQWERLSRLKGSFVYCGEALMSHRIHEGSETSRVISQFSRTEEDYTMFRMFWPERIARLLAKIYAISEKSNSVH